MSGLTIVGDGLAGLMLAHRLRQLEVPLRLFGDGSTNTPPVALVHLFAGRTFRRSALEVQAFQCAVEHWRAESLATEHGVRRWARPGDRLDRSASSQDVPAAYAPRRLEDGWFAYGPGFVIATQQLETRLRHDLSPLYERGRVEIHALHGRRVLALGLSVGLERTVSEWLPSVSWDVSSGRTVEASTVAEGTDGIVIGEGLHIAPHGRDGTVTLGGRASATRGALGDELQCASSLTGRGYKEISVWSGRRCSPAADRWPVLGWLDGETFAFFGFGSRALFWLPLCVRLAAAAIVNPAIRLPPALHWSRLVN